MDKYNSTVKFEDLVGMTLKSITQIDNDAINFESIDGRTFRMDHSQDCCESVIIEDVAGDLQDLVGAPILGAYEESNSDIIDGKPKYHDSHTWTFYRVYTVKGSVVIRWLGESNGYYSESVDFYETT